MITYPSLGKNGRLGNQMFQIASTLGLAHTFGQKASFPRWSYQPYFNIPAGFFSEQPGMPASVLARQIAPRHRNYLQDFHLFSEIDKEIREYFKPSQAFAEALQKKYADFLQVPDKTAIHIRRTDYTMMNKSYRSLPLAYYEDGIRRLRREFPTTEFFVFSDDIEWCKNNLPRECHFVSESFAFELNDRGFPQGNATDVEDLLLMTLCQHHICSNSTYAWWAAYLSENEDPIIPREWFGEDLADLKMEHYLLPKWRPIETPRPW